MSDPGGAAAQIRLVSEGYHTDTPWTISRETAQLLDFAKEGFGAEEIARIHNVKEWTHPSAELPEKAIDRDPVLTNVMLYWLTAASSAQLNYESMHSHDWPTPSTVPTGVAVFAEDIPIRRVAEQGNNVVRWSGFGRGGHFPAMEVPDLLVSDVRELLRGVR